MTIDRRRALALFGLGGVSAAGEAIAASPKGLHAGPATFEHGVASGDPLQDRVILWTRVTAPGAKAPVGVRWDVATDAGFKTIVKQGHATADAARDYTVKVDVVGLKPNTDYFYRFRHAVKGKATGKAVTGRTRTLPAGPTKDVVLAVVSCSLYPNGYFNAYDAIAKLPRVDAVLHLGDYIYEYGAAPGDYGMASPTAKTRVPDPPHELLSLDDYRRRHAVYKTDPACRPPMPARRGSWSGTTTRPPTTAGSAGPRTTSPPPRATGPSARRPGSRPITSGCRSASRRPGPCPRPPGAASSSATSSP